AQEDTCHRAEELLAHQLLRDREAVGEHVAQRAGDVVAIHGEAVRGIGAVPGDQAIGRRDVGVQQRRGKVGMGGHAQTSMAATGAPRNSASARAASDTSASSPGTSLSRSISVATAPTRARANSYRRHTASATGEPW